MASILKKKQRVFKHYLYSIPIGLTEHIEVTTWPTVCVFIRDEIRDALTNSVVNLVKLRRFTRQSGYLLISSCILLSQIEVNQVYWTWLHINNFLRYCWLVSIHIMCWIYSLDSNTSSRIFLAGHRLWLISNIILHCYSFQLILS